MPAHFTDSEADHRGEFRAKLVGGNNEIVAASEGYTDRDTAERWPSDMLRWVVEARQDEVRRVVHGVLYRDLHDVLHDDEIDNMVESIYTELIQ